VVFALDRAGVIDIAVKAAGWCRELEAGLGGTTVHYEYSPESFTGTEPEYAVEICEAVMDVIAPTEQNPLILNLPATVENYGPNVYADVIEWFGRNITERERVVLSLHPHNDRGEAVAACELGLLAGAQRVEGTLFGNGERTGNVDLVTLGMNLFAQGVDPCLDMSDLHAIRRVAEQATRIEVHPRHPYAGDFVYTAFSGSHQDAIKKGLGEIGEEYDVWDVPYLPIDPRHTGRSYDSVIRVNSQSGKGGVAYIMETEFGLKLPRRLQVEFSAVIQQLAEACGTEVLATDLWDAFAGAYLTEQPLALLGSEVSTHAGRTEITAQMLFEGKHRTVAGAGGGPIEALVRGVGAELGEQFEVLDFAEHAVGEGSDALACAFVELRRDGKVLWGVGRDSSVLEASLSGVVSAVNHHLACG
jgi:2-isopropylmalate synthase